MAVHYKFKSAKNYESLPIEGKFISVAMFKERIFVAKHLWRGTDFNLVVSNAQTNEEYVDDTSMIPNNTSVLVRRVPGWPQKPIIVEHDKPNDLKNKVEENLPPPSRVLIVESSAARSPDETDWDDFGSDLFAAPDAVPVPPINPHVSPSNETSEERRIKALVDAPAVGWQCQTRGSYGPGRGFGRSMSVRMMTGGTLGRSGLEGKKPPLSYICHRCNVPGHFIQYCPTNGDPDFYTKKVRPPTGIKKSMIMATPEGSHALPSRAVAVSKLNGSSSEKDTESLSSTRSVPDFPPELHCALCKQIMKEAMITTCCFRSFCDKCIRDYIISKSACICGAKNILAADLVPNVTLRETIQRLELSSSSSEHTGSLVQVQESACHIQPKAPSPTLSAPSKTEGKRPHTEDSPYVKDGEGRCEGKAVNALTNSLENKATMVKNADLSDEPTSIENATLPEEFREKLVDGKEVEKKTKNKKKCLPEYAADIQLGVSKDLGTRNCAGLPSTLPAYDNYWAVGGMPWGFDQCMIPLIGTVPYMDYTPGPSGAPFDGTHPQGYFGAEGYMSGVIPQSFRVHSMDREIRRDVSRAAAADVSLMKSNRYHTTIVSQSNASRADLPVKAMGLDRRYGLACNSPQRAGKRKTMAVHDGDDDTFRSDAKAELKPNRNVSSSSQSRPVIRGRDEGRKRRRPSEIPNGFKEHEPGHRPMTRPNSSQIDHKATKMMDEFKEHEPGHRSRPNSFRNDCKATKVLGGFKEHEPGHSSRPNSFRADRKPAKSPAHDHYTSEEDGEWHFRKRPSSSRDECDRKPAKSPAHDDCVSEEEGECHFKRRPSWSRDEREGGLRHSRVSRDECYDGPSALMCR